MRSAPDKGYYALRFKILQRDDFTCQYCGQHAPDVVLHVDHIKSVCDGGTDEEDNLITSCAACNWGKEALRARVYGRRGKAHRTYPKNWMDVPNPDEPTWEALVALEPKLQELLKEVQTLKDDGAPSFCPHLWWYGRASGGLSWKNRLSNLVGPEMDIVSEDHPEREGQIMRIGTLPIKRRDMSNVPPLLRSSLAWHAAYRTLYKALPPHRNCYHTEVQPWLYL